MRDLKAYKPPTRFLALDKTTLQTRYDDGFYSSVVENNYMIPKFEIGFWHPFGPHAGETTKQILTRKNDEIKKNGWTLWSFQFRQTLNLWYSEIVKLKPDSVLVFCSDGNGAVDPLRPNDKKEYCNYFLPVGEKLKKIPELIEVPHPMRNVKRGSAFIVKEIIDPADFKPINISWLKRDGWQTSRLPTRPEYLIRPDITGSPMRNIRAILVLKAPYLAEVGIRYK